MARLPPLRVGYCGDVRRFSRLRSESVGLYTVMETNKRAPGKGGIPSLLAVERARPALPEHERSATLRA